MGEAAPFAALAQGALILGALLVWWFPVLQQPMYVGILMAFGYAVLVDVEPRYIATVQAVAAGALLVVVVNEMVPIAVRGVQRWAGVLAAAGFVFSAALTWASGTA